MWFLNPVVLLMALTVPHYIFICSDGFDFEQFSSWVGEGCLGHSGGMVASATFVGGKQRWLIAVGFKCNELTLVTIEGIIIF